ncbi:MAG TPA: head GIN domain-containing protein [Allosphingosinicella sp.]|nr:head GIN domain-containing protein [Allosphingosinicella sp.]
MRGSAILMASMLALAAGGCSAGAREGERGAEQQHQARPAARRDFQVGQFQSVSLTGPSDVNVTVGGAPSVRAEGDAEMIERLEIAVVNGDLRIGFKDGSSGRSMFGRERGVTVHVTVPSLAAVNLTGSGDINVDRVEGEHFAGNISGSGDINVGAMRIGEAAFNLAGSGDIQAAGTAQRAAVSLAGSGDIQLGQLETRTLTVSLMGSGDIHARATETAQVALMGPGDVTVSGPARCQINQRGPGNVRCNA